MTELKEITDKSKLYEENRSLIKSGDILLCSGNAKFSKLIKRITGSKWSHVAFIINIEAIDRLMVLESVESIGVRTVPLSSYISNYNGSGIGYDGDLRISRHNQMQAHNIHNLSRKAVDLLGHQYDSKEIMRITAKIVASMVKDSLYCDLPDGDDAYICSEYVDECFKSIGINVHTECGYIIPDNFATDENIRTIINFENSN